VAGDVIRVDIEPDHLEANIPATVGITGDARRTMDALTATLCRRDQTQAATRAARLRTAIDTEADQTGADYRPWLSAMREALPHDGVIAADSTLATYLGFRSLHIPEGGAFLYPNAYGTLGYALPAAIGARIAQPGRPAAVLIGDGGFLFTCAELLTAAEQGLGIPVIVWNDRGYGCIRTGMEDQGVTPLGVDFAIPDLPALARGFGSTYIHADRPQRLRQAVQEARERAAPTVIEIKAWSITR